MRFFVPSSGKFTKDIPDNQVKGFLSHYPDAIPAEEGMTPNPSAAPAIAPAAKALQETQAAAPASEPEGSWLDALATGAGRGLTADFLDELRGAAAAAGGQIGGRLAGVAPEFLAQENFYEQGRNEERARQKKLEEESPWLTAGGAMAGATVPFLLSGGTAAAPAGGAFLARFGQGAAASYPRLAPVAERFLTAAPSLAGYGAASGVGRSEDTSVGGNLAEAGKGAAESLVLGAGLEGARGALGAANQARRNLISRALAWIGKEADQARVETAGPAAVKAAEEGVGIPETARVMRETGMAGMKTPKGLAAKSAEVHQESGRLIGQIVSDVDKQAGAYLQRLDEAHAALKKAQDEVTGSLSGRSAEAEKAAARAAELEKTAADAQKRLAASQQELNKASIGTETPPFAPQAAQRQVGTEIGAQKPYGQKFAENEARKAQLAADEAEKLQLPEAGFLRMLADSAQKKAESSALFTEQFGEMATAAPPEGRIPIRSAVAARRALDTQQREVDMMAAAAKKAREEATRLAGEAAPSSEQAANLDKLKANVDQLTAEVGKRKVDSKTLSSRMRSEAQGILDRMNIKDPANLEPEPKKRYDLLIDAAKRIEAEGDFGLAAAYERLKPIEDRAKWEYAGKEVELSAQAKAAREQSRFMREGMDVAAEGALPASEYSSALSSPYATVGRGERIPGMPSGREAYQSVRRVSDVARDIAGSTELEMKRMRQDPLKSRVMEQWITGPAEYKWVAAKEKAAAAAPGYAEPAPALTPAKESMLRALQYGGGVRSFEDMLNQIDEESRQ